MMTILDTQGFISLGVFKSSQYLWTKINLAR